MAKFVTAREAMVIAARAMEAPGNARGHATRQVLADARVVLAAAAQIQAGCQIAVQIFHTRPDTFILFCYGRP